MIQNYSKNSTDDRTTLVILDVYQTRKQLNNLEMNIVSIAIL